MLRFSATIIAVSLVGAAGSVLAVDIAVDHESHPEPDRTIDRTISHTVDRTVDRAAHDSAPAEHPVEHPVSLEPDVVVVGADHDRDAVAAAIERFASNGLELPDLEVRFHDDDAACGGHLGLFQDRFAPWRVLVCSDLAFVVTHELAHAWEAANLDDADRAAYTRARGLPTWDAAGFGWNDQAVEDAAFTIQQNLMAGGADLDSPMWQERTEAYALLTGTPSPLLAAA